MRRLSSVAVVALAPALFVSEAGAQTTRAENPFPVQHGQPSTAKGDWPMYFADPSGSRYSPQDQINASNFNKLELAWHFKTDNLGGRPEFKLEGTPLEDQWHGLYHRRFAPRRGRAERQDRRTQMGLQPG